MSHTTALTRLLERTMLALENTRRLCGVQRVAADEPVRAAEIAALRDALAHQWQPIETAPPGNDSILVYVPPGPVGSDPIGEHTGVFKVYRFSDNWVVEDQRGYDLDDAARLIRQPTHWMPLPEPPDAG